MNARERLQTVWNRRHPDRIPWSPLVGDSILRSAQPYFERLTQEQQAALSGTYRYPSVVPLPTGLGFEEPLLWDLVQDVGGAIIPEVPTARALDPSVEVQIQPQSDDQTAYTFHTPWGDLHEIVGGSGSAETIYRVRFAISERSDYDVMAKVVEARRFEPCPDVFTDKERLLGDRGACMVRGVDQPMVALYRVRDPSELIFDLADEPDRVTEVLDLLHERAMEAYRLVAQGPGVAVLSGMAFITTQLLSPRLFERHVLPYLAEYTELVHEAGKLMFCHMCGHIRHLLPMMREIGIDGIDSLTSPPIGDTELDEFWQLLGDNAILVSGIDTDVLLNGTPQDVRAHTRDVIERTRGRHIILRSADEVPFGTPIENLAAVGDEAAEMVI